MAHTKQFSTFYIANKLYGIDVADVQEVTRSMSITEIPLAPKFIKGLINLRGQIATAVSLKDLFLVEQIKEASDNMNVVCKVDNLLLSLIVDRVGDVMEVENSDFEPTPETVSKDVRKYLKGVYKTPQQLLSVIEVKTIIEDLNK